MAEPDPETPKEAPEGAAAPEAGERTERAEGPPPAAQGTGSGDAVTSVPLGTLINNNYRVQSLINAGGMGEVFRGENAFTGDLVAVKIILPSLAQDEKVVALFKREARILGQLSDEAIVRYHNFVHDPDLDRFCLIMEFIDGTPLSDHVKANGPISVDEAQRLILRLAEGLDKAHSREVTHRDLSPDNVMLRGGDVDRPVLIDFGIAKSAEMAEATLHGQLAGKFKYISPEQLGHFDGVIGPRTDVYGLALLISAVVRGAALDMGGSVVDAVNARREIPDLSDVPDALRPLLAHMLEPNPADRPARMSDVARMVRDPSAIPAKYHGGAVAAPAPAGDRTIVSTAPGTVQQPPHMALSVPPTAPRGLDETSGSPFGGGSAAPFSATMSAPPTAPAPDPAPRSRLAILAGVLALAAIGVGGYLAYEPDGPAPPPDAEDTAVAPPEATPAPGAGLPPPDTSRREGFLAAYEAGACTYATRIGTGINAGRIEAFAAEPGRFTGLTAAYGAAFGAEPAVIERQVTPAQCAALDLARALQGRPAPPPALSLDTDVMTSGGSIVGRLRDRRGRPTWLFLVTAAGGVHDLSDQLQPQGDGSSTFSFGMAAGAGAEDSSQLLVAVASAEPLVNAAAAPDGAVAADLLPLVLTEIEGRGGTAAAALAYFQLAAN